MRCIIVALPIIVPVGVTLLTGGYGVKKLFETKKIKGKVNNVNEFTKLKVNNAKQKLNKRRKHTKKTIESLGKLKIKILSTTINKFVEDFSEIKEIELKRTVGIKEVQHLYELKTNLKHLKNDSYKAVELTKYGLSSLGAGAVMAYGTYGIAGIVGTASTGTAISSLYGVASTNATLAWLGGGTLAGGGMGIVGGMSILGGIVVGPALAVGGSLLSSKARIALNEAYINENKADNFCHQVDTICTVLEGINKRAEQFIIILNKLNRYLQKYISDMCIIISKRGKNWNEYTIEEKKKIAKCLLTAQTIKKIIDTKLLTDEGKLEQKTAYVLKRINKEVSIIQKM